MFKLAFACNIPFFRQDLLKFEKVTSRCDQIFTSAFPLLFKVTPKLWAEPLKKKKKIDPALQKAREEKKKAKIVKQIKKAESFQLKLKPISDTKMPQILTSDWIERRKRQVEIPESVQEERVILLKKWSKFKGIEKHNDSEVLERIILAQKKALDELRSESEELYQAAVEIDNNLLPFKYSGPTETPPKEDYPVQDGAYVDVSKKWE